jgi:tetratricopeptide (TPR) repeat protein
VKATAQLYPYPQLAPYPIEDNVAHWRGLQGEVLSAMLAGAYGAVPNFGLHVSHPDGKVEGREYTANLILDLVLHLMSGWSVALPALTMTMTLEEALLRLVDSCGSAAFLADRLVEMLKRNRRLIEGDDVDLWKRFHFQAVEATLLSMLGRDNPRAGDWAYDYLMVRCVARSADRGELDDRFRLSPNYVATTISYKHAWNATATVLGSLLKMENKSERAEQIRRLRVAVEDLGHKELFDAVLKGSLRIGTRPAAQGDGSADAKEEHTPQSLAAWILGARAKHGGLEISRMLELWWVSWYSDCDAVARLFDLLEPATMQMPEERADLLAWFGERMKLLGAPALAVARIGEDAAPWEDELSTGSRLRLWTERSNALRLSGERTRALEIALATLDLALENPEISDSNKAVAYTNYGILLRENGRFAEAERALRQAISVASDAGCWAAYNSLAATYLQMAREAEAAEALKNARQTAGGPDNWDTRISMLVAEIAARLTLRDYERADALLRECPSPEVMCEAGLVGYATVLQMLALRADGRDEHRTTAAAIVARLTKIVETFEKAGNALQAQNACHSAAMLAQAFDFPDAEVLWYRDAEVSANSGHLPHALTVIELAIIGIRENPARFDEAVSIIPFAIAQQAHGISLEALTMELLSPLDGPFRRLTELAYSQQLGPAAVQILAELRRNAHRKARATVLEAVPPIGSALATAQAMPPNEAPFIVLEWCDVENGSLLGLVTYVAPDDPEIAFLETTPELDLFGAAGQIGSRLENWRRSRSGEPHIVPQWDIVRAWLRGVTGALLVNGGHVVVIDHPALTGLPFHIALAPEWTVSSAPDWLAVEAAVRANKSGPASPRLGVLHAPRSNETTAVREALAASAERVRQLADTRRLVCANADPGVADADALRRLLVTADVLKILCHGQVSKEDHEVVLLIDHDGRPPPGYSFGALLQTTRGHRFGRTQLEGLGSTSRTVFLGACSSGAVSVAGLDERTSLAVLLGDTGTKAVVAPRWKIDAQLALPILDDAMERFLDGVPLGNAVSEAACAAIVRGVPSWQANAFVVEGAWE